MTPSASTNGHAKNHTKSKTASETKATATPTKPALQGAWSDSAARVLHERYLLKDATGTVIETPDEAMWRVAFAVAQAERKYTPDLSSEQLMTEHIYNRAADFYAMMVSRRFMPNSPTLMNAGKGNGLQLSACYVVPVEDSLEGIFDAIKHAALIHKSGGGTGMSFSRLRPKNSVVGSTKGVSSGPVSFMKIFDAATEHIKQGGSRRGANMGVLRVDHPDILEFINCKRTGGVTNFNISVGITNAFMAALADAEDDSYDLVDPRDQHVVGHLSANMVMSEIIDAAWATGDPGLIFLDRVNESPANPTPSLETIETTNPCVIGSTRIATIRGLERMDDLYRQGGEVTVVTDARNNPSRGTESHLATPIFSTGVNKVYTLTTAHGHEITATAYHKFLTPNRGMVSLSELTVGDRLLLQCDEGGWSQVANLPQIQYGERGAANLRGKIARGEAEPPTLWSQELGEILGYTVGDGHIRHDSTSNVLSFAFAKEDSDIRTSIMLRMMEWFGASGNLTERHGSYQLMYRGVPADFLLGLGVTTAKAPEKRVPESIFTAPREAVIGFLRGIFSADGTVNVNTEKSSCSVRLASSSKGLLQDVQMLLGNLGIVGTIRLRRAAGTSILPDSNREPAEYQTAAQYELILDKANRNRFATEVGFIQAEKQVKLIRHLDGMKYKTRAEPFTTTIDSIVDAGFAETYDTTEPETHSLIFHGIVTSNCGEQPLGSFDACNLGSVNLSRFVLEADAAATERIAWDDLRETVHTAVRFLDNVIDINEYPLPQVREKVLANRRIGLGVMGWADMLFKLDIRYDSQTALDLAERVMKFIQEEADAASHALVGERDIFPNQPYSRYAGDWDLRNSNRTTVAPTGTISIIADCSSGIEPIFALAFQHRVKQPDGSYRVLDFVNPLFVQALDACGLTSDEKKLVLEHVKSHGSLAGLRGNGIAALKLELALGAFVTAQEIDPIWHIRMQAAFQRYVDSAISKTVNLPNHATRADVRDAYQLAWASGCLGITIFRDGCKGEQVLNVGVKAEEKPAAPAEHKGSALEEAEANVLHLTDRLGEAQTENEQLRERLENVHAYAEELEARLGFGGRVPVHQGGLKQRPAVVRGYTRQVQAPEGKLNITINSDGDGPFEVFLNVGRAGSDIAAMAEGIGRLISFTLRLDSAMSQEERLHEIARQLQGIGGSGSIGFGPHRVASLADAIARALALHLSEMEQSPAASETVVPSELSLPIYQVTSVFGNGNGNGHKVKMGNLCSSCGNTTMVREEGCMKCLSCGTSRC